VDEVICLTLAGGDVLFIRRHCVIAAHLVVPGEADSRAKSKIYLSNGNHLFVREAPDECVLEKDN
jgi:hypothetical protein